MLPTTSRSLESIFISFPERFSHCGFFRDRNWAAVDNFWCSIVKSKTLPHWITSDYNTEEDEGYGLTDLKAIKECAHAELSGEYKRGSRKTFALRIGYAGTMYQGYQSQGGKESGVKTVEDDVRDALGRSSVCAGRTDKGVSAVSQVISFHSTNTERWRGSFPDDPEPDYGEVRYFPVPSDAPAASAGATEQDETKKCAIYDVDIGFVNDMLKRIENRELHYDGFAFRDTRPTEGSRSDLCTLQRARAFYADLSQTNDNNSGDSIPAIVIELVGTRFLRRMVRNIVGTVIRESQLPLEQRDNRVLEKITETRQRDRASSSVPASGLCMCGVGYDLKDLSVSKFAPTNPKTIARNKRKLAEAAAAAAAISQNTDNGKDENSSS